MFDFNQLMQLASLTSALGGGGSAQANASAAPQAPVAAGAAGAVPQIAVPQVSAAPANAGAVAQPGTMAPGTGVSGFAAGAGMAGGGGGQTPESGVGGGVTAPQTGSPVPTAMPDTNTPITPPQTQKTGFDRFTEWMGGGMEGTSPEAIADRENFRKMNTIMALGTSLGGAIAGGPGASVVGDVSSMLNQYAQGNIMASNAAEKESSMNELLNRQVEALGGRSAQVGTGASGVNAAVMPGATGSAASGQVPTGTSALSNAPIQAPTQTSTIGEGAGSMTVADLEKRMLSLFG